VLWGHTYLQEYIEGTPVSAQYVAAGSMALLLGVTQQLIGEPWLNAKDFAYGGNVGPLPLDAPLARRLRRLGQQLAAGGGLRGLFGVDGVLRDGEFWPIEINPRYTAALEVLEYATGLRSLHLHRLAFEDEESALNDPIPEQAGVVVGKAILYSGGDIDFPADGPWMATLTNPRPVEEMPAFADLPSAADHIKHGSPVLTLLERAVDIDTCVARLRQRVVELSGTLGWSAMDG
jgi:predicted ATP-grasp superfamily ATP-dependent carboligase